MNTALLNRSAAEVQTPFIWTTQTGERIPVTKMRSSHLFYVVRMIFNHTVPPTLQIAGCQRYDGPQRWPMARRLESVKAMLEELARRPNDLPPWMYAQLEHMRNACKIQHAEIPEGDRDDSSPEPVVTGCDHVWQYARCAVIDGDYLVELKCKRCHKTDLL